MDAPKRCIDFCQIFKKKFLGAGIIGAGFWVETQDRGMGVSKNGASHHKNLTFVSHCEIISHNVKWCGATMMQRNIMVWCNITTMASWSLCGAT